MQSQTKALSSGCESKTKTKQMSEHITLSRAKQLHTEMLFLPKDLSQDLSPILFFCGCTEGALWAFELGPAVCETRVLSPAPVPPHALLVLFLQYPELADLIPLPRVTVNEQIAIYVDICLPVSFKGAPQRLEIEDPIVITSWGGGVSIAKASAIK